MCRFMSDREAGFSFDWGVIGVQDIVQFYCSVSEGGVAVG